MRTDTIFVWFNRILDVQRAARTHIPNYYSFGFFLLVFSFCERNDMKRPMDLCNL